jgi:hypothetical protein
VPINTHKLQTGSNVTLITFANYLLTAEGTELVTWQEDKKGSQQGPHVCGDEKMANARQGKEACRKLEDIEVEM